MLGVPYEKVKYADTYLTCKVVNNGPREVVIEDIYWRQGWITFYRVGQSTRHKDSSPLPSRIRDGEAIHLRFEPTMFYHGYLDEKRIHLHGKYQLTAKVARKLLPFTLRAVVITSTGKHVSARIRPSVIRDFTDEHELDY